MRLRQFAVILTCRPMRCFGEFIYMKIVRMRKYVFLPRYFGNWGVTSIKVALYFFIYRSGRCFIYGQSSSSVGVMRPCNHNSVKRSYTLCCQPRQPWYVFIHGMDIKCKRIKMYCILEGKTDTSILFSYLFWCYLC